MCLCQQFVTIISIIRPKNGPVLEGEEFIRKKLYGDSPGLEKT